MATKQQKAGASKKPPDKKSLNVEAHKESLSGAYANAVFFSSGPDDFQLDFVRVDTAVKGKTDDKGYLVSRVIMPLGELESFRDLLDRQISKSSNPAKK